MVLFNLLLFFLLVSLNQNYRVSSLMVALHYLKMKSNARQVANHRIFQLHGKVSASQRIQLMQTMKTSRGKMILLSSFGTGSTGHNLQMFTMVIFLDRNWNLQVLHQPPIIFCTPYCVQM
jgi:SNF2 family DNA or RNA helicase